MADKLKQILQNIQKIVTDLIKKLPEEAKKLQKGASNIDTKKITGSIQQTLDKVAKQAPDKLKSVKTEAVNADKNKIVDNLKQFLNKLLEKSPSQLKQLKEKAESIRDKAKENTKKMSGDVCDEDCQARLEKFTTTKTTPPPPSSTDIQPTDHTPVPMKYPYTLTAKMAQFPYKHYYDHNWMWRYYFYALIACVPIFYKLSRMG